MSESLTPKIGSTVIISTHDGLHNIHTTIAHVLAIAGAAGGLATDAGHPALTVAYPDPVAAPAVLSSVNWHAGYQRRTGVLHNSHPDALAGKVGICWGALDLEDYDNAGILQVTSHPGNRATERTVPEASVVIEKPQLLRSELEAPVEPSPAVVIVAAHPGENDYPF